MFFANMNPKDKKSTGLVLIDGSINQEKKF